MNNKQEYLTRLRAEKARWESALSRVSEAQAASPDLPDQWSVKDVMAHLMAWQQVTNARLDAALSSREPAYPAWFTVEEEAVPGQPNETNARIFYAYHDQPWPAVYQRWRAGFQHVLESVETLPESDLLQPARYPWLGDSPLAAILDGTLGHHGEHMEWLADWFKNKGA